MMRAGEHSCAGSGTTGTSMACQSLRSNPPGPVRSAVDAGGWSRSPSPCGRISAPDADSFSTATRTPRATSCRKRCKVPSGRRKPPACRKTPGEKWPLLPCPRWHCSKPSRGTRNPLCFSNGSVSSDISRTNRACDVNVQCATSGDHHGRGHDSDLQNVQKALRVQDI